MKLPYYQIDAFADRLFAGNPAGVCLLDRWPSDELMQAIAAENNLSETAFLLGGDGVYDLRWFTPAAEVDLCGHATLAGAHTVFEYLDPGRDTVTFRTRASGELRVDREDDMLVMDFPAVPPAPVAAADGLALALGAEPEAVLAAPRDYLAVFAGEDDVAALTPSMAALEALDRAAVMATAPGASVDFVSRFFAPRLGIPEDPVTGSAHCTLAPFWADRLGRNPLRARQISPRGGEILCRVAGDRVFLKGACALYLKGEITA